MSGCTCRSACALACLAFSWHCCKLRRLAAAASLSSSCCWISEGLLRCHCGDFSRNCTGLLLAALPGLSTSSNARLCTDRSLYLAASHHALCWATLPIVRYSIVRFGWVRAWQHIVMKYHAELDGTSTLCSTYFSACKILLTKHAQVSHVIPSLTLPSLVCAGFRLP